MGSKFGKKQAVAALQALAGALFCLLLLLSGKPLYGLLFLFVCFFSLTFFLPEPIFYHPLFDIGLLSITSLFFVGAVVFDPTAPWRVFFLYYFLFFACVVAGSEKMSLKSLFVHFALLGGAYIALLAIHGRNVLEEGLPVLIGAPGFVALSALYVRLGERMDRDREKREEEERLRMELISTLAHDIKQPLSAIMGYAELINSGPQADIIERILHNARNIFELLSGFLDVQRNEALGLRDPVVVSLSELLSGLISDFIPVASAKGVNLSHSLTEDLITGDRSQLERLFRNLISNAIKFTPNGGNIHVRTGRINGEIKVEVEDSGEGIKEEDLAVLFTRFKRFGKQRSEGSGLGLYIAKSIVEAHGGRIEVRSSYGRGSAFSVFFPNGAKAPEDDAQMALFSEKRRDRQPMTEADKPYVL